MSEQTYDFRIIYVKLAELHEQLLTEQEKLTEDEIKEFDEIRALREMVMEVQVRPQMFFTAT